MQKEGLSKCFNLKGSYARISISDIKFMTVWDIFVFYFLNLFPLLESGWGYLTPVVSFMESSFYSFY